MLPACSVDFIPSPHEVKQGYLTAQRTLKHGVSVAGFNVAAACLPRVYKPLELYLMTEFQAMSEHLPPLDLSPSRPFPELSACSLNGSITVVASTTLECRASPGSVISFQGDSTDKTG